MNPQVTAAQQVITSRFIDAIQSGIANPSAWKKSWQALAGALPINPFTGRYYRGGNSLLFSAIASEQGYATHLWAGYGQWTDAHRQVKKGEKATWGIYWARKVDRKNEERTILVPSAFKVFNFDQTEPVDEKAWTPAEPQPRSWDDWSEADAVLAATGASINYDGGDRAYYRPVTDSIHLPERDAFLSLEGFYGTAFHEVGHWTGHESRLNRLEKIQRWGDNAYAYEELVAELTSAFVLTGLGVQVEPSKDSGSYLASWLRAAKAEPTLLWKAAGDASQAAALIVPEKVAQPA